MVTLILRIRAMYDVIEIDVRNRMRRLTCKRNASTHTVSLGGRYIWCLNYRLGRDDNFGNGWLRHRIAKDHGVIR